MGMQHPWPGHAEAKTIGMQTRARQPHGHIAKARHVAKVEAGPHEHATMAKAAHRPRHAVEAKAAPHGHAAAKA